MEKKIAISHPRVSGADLLNDLLYRQYIERLQGESALPMENEDQFEENLRKHVRLLHIERLVYEKKKEKIEELLNLYSSMYGSGCALLFLLQSQGEDIHLYLGVRKVAESTDITSAQKILESCLQGQFTGSHTRNLRNDEIKEVLASLQMEHIRGIAALTGIPSKKTSKEQDFVQGLDRYMDAMRGKSYTLMVIAEPTTEAQIEHSLEGYAHLATLLSVLSERQIQRQQSDSFSLSQSEQESFSQALASTLGSTLSTTTTQTKGESGPSKLAYGLAAGLGVLGGVAAGPMGAAMGIGLGIALGGQSSDSESRGKTQSTSSSQTQTATTTQSKGSSTTQTHGSSQAETVTQRDRLLRHHLEQIDRQIQRIKQGSRYGFWNTGIYFLSQTTEDAKLALAIFQGLFRGEESDLEKVRSVVWNESQGKYFQKIKSALRCLQHPAFDARALFGPSEALHTNILHVHPTTLLSSAELALVMGLPERSLPGLSVRSSATFGRQVNRLRKDKQQAEICVGNVFHLGQEDPMPLLLGVDDFTAHVFITGTTGSGKTNACFNLLKGIHDKGIPFLVIEPSKGEYGCLRSLASKSQPVRKWCVGSNKAPLLRMNPFRFPKEIHVLEHIDRLGQLFSAAFPMYAAMPALLDEALHGIYEVVGWDLGSSHFMYKEIRYPTLHDLVRFMPEVIASSSYSEQMKSDYSGALLTRLRSLTRGLRGQTFCPTAHEETSDEHLFDQSCVVDLRGVGSSETRALLMGMLLLRLYEYRQEQGSYKTLRHITVMEEAHHLLRRRSTEQHQEQANPQGLAVEMFSNAIAEMRAMGEGFVIVDQSASSLDTNVLKNTNTKIILRTPFHEDRSLVGHSANMTSEQIAELGRLETGVAAIYQNDWVEPVLCKFPQISLEEPAAKDRSETAPIHMLLFSCIPFWTALPQERETKLFDLTGDSVAEMAKVLACRLEGDSSSYLEGLLVELYREKETEEVYNRLISCFMDARPPLSRLHAAFAVQGYLIRRLGLSAPFAVKKISQISGWEASNLYDRLSPYWS